MKKDTHLVCAGRAEKWTGKSVNPRIERASTIVFDSFAEMRHAASLGHKSEDYYGRRGTSTTFAFCQAMAELDNAAGCYAYPCGTSAITSSLLSFLSAGDHLLMVDSVYQPTRNFCSRTLARLGVATTYYDPLIGAGIENLVRENTRVIFMESPGSLSMEVQDVPAIAAVANRHSIVSMVDNTYATPLNFRPLDVGVDIAIQSATKYLNGHSDVMLGIACANDTTWPILSEHSFELGLCTSVDDLYTSLRGLRTLGVRMREHERNALAVADWLIERDEVDHLRHPAFTSCPGHREFKRDFSGGNGLFSMVLKKGSKTAIAAMLDGMRHFKMGFSWGGYESLILAVTDLSKIRSATGWSATGPLIRLHVGLEDPQDLISDLADGFTRFKTALN
ncbi:MAG: cystathionine beta-lyase [Gammaproteobacteria bacterium]|nr:cystathionine beta-lyase [Gammaproteobacteria bacterium]